MSAERGPVIGLRETSSRTKRPDGKVNEESSEHLLSLQVSGLSILLGPSDANHAPNPLFCGYRFASGRCTLMSSA